MVEFESGSDFQHHPSIDSMNESGFAENGSSIIVGTEPNSAEMNIATATYALKAEISMKVTDVMTSNVMKITMVAGSDISGE